MKETQGNKRGRKSLTLFVFGCFAVAATAGTDQVLPPRNVSLSWVTDFRPYISWAPPENFGKDCKYRFQSKHLGLNEPTTSLFFDAKCDQWKTETGTVLDFAVQTVCNGTESEPAGLNITYPILVNDVQCKIRSTNLTKCSWQPDTHVPDLQFYYWLMKQGGGSCEYEYHLKMCPTSVYKDGVKTGCHVPNDNDLVDMYLLFNGTINGTVVKNVFTISMFHNVKPPALNWTANKTGGKFNITWVPVAIKSIPDWCYSLSYTECGEKKKNETRGDSITLKVVPKCRYTMTMKAVKGECEDKGTAESEASHVEIFEAEMNRAIFAVILIPVMFSILVVVALVCFRKHKPKLFPKIPGIPPNFMDDILDNNNDRSTNPGVLSRKEEECNIALVIEDQPASPES